MNGMPHITISGPKIIDLGIKRVLVKEITDALEKAYKLPPDAYVIVIEENPQENVAVGGQLLIDKIKKKDE
jgi:4-oxalocrotonate tautomerase